MWAQLLGTIVGAAIGWALLVYVLFAFLGFPPVHEVVQAVVRALLFVAVLLT